MASTVASPAPPTAARPRVAAAAAPLGGSAAAPTVRFRMIARAASDGSTVTWLVTSTPDLLGANAPVAIAAGSASVLRRWTT